MTRRQGGFCAACGKPELPFFTSIKFFINRKTMTVHKILQFHSLDLYSECLLNFWKIQAGEQFKKDISVIPENQLLELEIHGDLPNILYIVGAMGFKRSSKAKQELADIDKGLFSDEDTFGYYVEVTTEDITAALDFTGVPCNIPPDTIIINSTHLGIEFYNCVNHKKQRTLKYFSQIGYSAFRLYYTRNKTYLRLVEYLATKLRKVKLKSIFKTLDETLAGDINASELQMLFDKLKTCPISTLRDLKDLINAYNKATVAPPVRF